MSKLTSRALYTTFACKQRTNSTTLPARTAAHILNLPDGFWGFSCYFWLWLVITDKQLFIRFQQRLREMYNRLCFWWYQICCWIFSRFSEFWITGRVITSCKSARSSVTVAPSGNFIRELRSLIKIAQCP